MVQFGSVEDLPIATNIDMKEEVCTLEFIPKIPFDLIPLDANERGTQLIYE